MGFRESRARMNRRLDAMTDRTDDPLALGFGQSAALAFEGFRAEDLTTSESNAVERFYGARNNTLDRMAADGEIPADVMDSFRDYSTEVDTSSMSEAERVLQRGYAHHLDYHGLAAWSNENLGTEFETDDTVMIETMRRERESRARRLANGNWAGELVGNMGAALTDPLLAGLTIATLPMGPAAIPARGALQSVVVRAALLEGMVATATEVPIQAEVHRFKYRIDSPYTFEDAVANTLIAGGAGALLGGFAQASVQLAVKYWANKGTKEFLEESGGGDVATVDGRQVSPEEQARLQGEAERAGDILREGTRPLEVERRDVDRLAAELSEVEKERVEIGEEGDDDHLPSTVGDHLDRLLEAEGRMNEPEIPEPEPVPEMPDTWEPADPAEWDLEVEMEDGTVRTLRDLDSEYEQQLKAEEEQLDALTACTLLPSGGSQ